MTSYIRIYVTYTSFTDFHYKIVTYDITYTIFPNSLHPLVYVSLQHGEAKEE